MTCSWVDLLISEGVRCTAKEVGFKGMEIFEDLQKKAHQNSTAIGKQGKIQN